MLKANVGDMPYNETLSSFYASVNLVVLSDYSHSSILRLSYAYVTVAMFLIL